MVVVEDEVEDDDEDEEDDEVVVDEVEVDDEDVEAVDDVEDVVLVVDEVELLEEDDDVGKMLEIDVEDEQGAVMVRVPMSSRKNLDESLLCGFVNETWPSAPTVPWRSSSSFLSFFDFASSSIFPFFLLYSPFPFISWKVSRPTVSVPVPSKSLTFFPSFPSARTSPFSIKLAGRLAFLLLMTMAIPLASSAKQPVATGFLASVNMG